MGNVTVCWVGAQLPVGFRALEHILSPPVPCEHANTDVPHTHGECRGRHAALQSDLGFKPSSPAHSNLGQMPRSTKSVP